LDAPAARAPACASVLRHTSIEPGVSIRLYGLERNHRKEPFTYERTFKLGDVAEYDSYNLSYLGVIAAIGERTVTLEAHGRRHRLSIFDFSWRNRHLDLEATAKRNLDTMQCI
jgi:hypothetical protein